MPWLKLIIELLWNACRDNWTQCQLAMMATLGLNKAFMGWYYFYNCKDFLEQLAHVCMSWNSFSLYFCRDRWILGNKLASITVCRLACNIYGIDIIFGKWKSFLAAYHNSYCRMNHIWDLHSCMAVIPVPNMLEEAAVSIITVMVVTSELWSLPKTIW